MMISALLLVGVPVMNAQEKSKEKEISAIEEKQMQKEFELKQKEIEAKQREVQKKVEEMTRRYAEEAIVWSDEFDNFRVVAMPKAEGNYFFTSGRAKTSWDFSKVVEDASFSNEFVFDVDKDAINMSVSISGVSNSGGIDVQIFAPGGKEFTTVRIDSFGSVNWKKSFRFDENNKDKIGTWKFKINAKGATGNFRISVQSF